MIALVICFWSAVSASFAFGWWVRSRLEPSTEELWAAEEQRRLEISPLLENYARQMRADTETETGRKLHHEADARSACERLIDETQRPM